MATTPTLTARAVADFLRASPARQRSILYSQKYPKKDAQKHRTPYYSTPLTAIRNYYRGQHDLSALSAVRNKIQSMGNATKRENNERVLRQFQANEAQIRRHLDVGTNHRFGSNVATVLVKLSTDVQALERDSSRFIYYHCKGEALAGTLAETTLAVAAWVLEQNDVEAKPGSIEYIDLFTGKVYRLSRRPSHMPHVLTNAAHVIESIWPDL